MRVLRPIWFDETAGVSFPISAIARWSSWPSTRSWSSHSEFRDVDAAVDQIVESPLGIGSVCWICYPKSPGVAALQTLGSQSLRKFARCLDAPRRGTRVFRRSFDEAVRRADRLDRVFDFRHPASEQKRAVKNTLSEPFRFLEPLQKRVSFSMVSAETTSKLTDFPGALPKSLQSQTPLCRWLKQGQVLQCFPQRFFNPFEDFRRVSL